MCRDLLLCRYLLLAALLPLAGCAEPTAAPAAASEQTPWYENGSASRDGTGRYYMGREIAQVMGHLGAGWLERPSREREERTDLLLKNLPLKPGDIAVDLGAGTGYFTLPIAGIVGPSGRAIAVDIQPEMLAIVAERIEQAGISNVDTILATPEDPRLPEDRASLVLLVDAYHEFSHPREVMLGVVRGLKPGGLVVLIEYRGEDPSVPIKPLHKMTQAQAIRELSAVGLDWVETREFLPQQHFMIFRKPGP